MSAETAASSATHELVQGVRACNRHAIARAINTIEAGGGEARALLTALQANIGHAHRIGITGAPGVGKSTLATAITRALRELGRTVAIIAVDPSSPFTKGALLGDRVRMAELDHDDSVFIRSMASRGALGGLSDATRGAADVLDAAGFELIIVETVGVGQSEVEVARATDTTVVVVSPESGDEIQAAKAGLMEVADLFVVNKCDRPGGNATAANLSALAERRRRHHPNRWAPEILRTEAIAARGIGDLVAAVNRHRHWLTEAV
jgi:LAO/AO transport system kinase